MSTITCFCGNTIDVDFPSEIDLEKSPKAESSILDGSFMTVSCTCGRLLKPEFPFRVFREDGSLDLFLVPELNRNSFLTGRFDTPASADIVIGFPELVERLTILRAGFDPRANEIAKYYLSRKAGPVEDIQIRFQGIESEKAVYHIFGLKSDEIAVVKLPVESLRKMEEDIETAGNSEPFKTIFEKPYISLSKVVVVEE